jgi:hypothetical protein
MVSLQDTPDHELSVIEVGGPQNSSDALWNGATVLYWGAADLIAGTGTQTGYFMNRHPNGDMDRGTFQGKITTAAGVVTMEGSWQFSGGTGAFSGLTGRGSYKGQFTSSTEVQVNWEGTYQLG